MKSIASFAALMVALSCGSAGAALIEEFLFSDPVGTALPATINSVVGGHPWADDIQGDLNGNTTNGLGQYSLANKSNNELGTALINNAPNITTGTVYGVMELTWAFDTGSLNTAENEEIRLSIINLDTAGSSSVTAEFAIIRQDDNTVTFSGAAVGTGSASIVGSTVNTTQSSNFIGVVGVNLDTNIYSVYYSADGGGTFSEFSGGLIDTARIAAQVRMVLNNDLSQDSVLIDRVALYTHNPYPGQIPGVPEPSTVSLVLLSLVGLNGVRRSV